MSSTILRSLFFATLSTALHLPHAWNTTYRLGKGTECHLPPSPPPSPPPAGTIDGEIDIRWYATDEINMHVCCPFHFRYPYIFSHLSNPLDSRTASNRLDAHHYHRPLLTSTSFLEDTFTVLPCSACRSILLSPSSSRSLSSKHEIWTIQIPNC